MPAAVEPELLTLPLLAGRWSASLDGLRRLIRREPELARLGRWVGGVRFFTVAEAELIRQADAERRRPRAG